MKILILSLLLMLLLGAAMAAAASLSSYPEPFVTGSSFNAQIIVGGDMAPATDALAATDIAVSLQQIASAKITAGTAQEFDASRDSILIGLPCQNPAIAAVLGTSSCDLGMAAGTGYLMLVEKGGAAHLIVTGKAVADTRKAARALAKYRQYAFSGTEMQVTGTLDKPEIKQAAQPLQLPKAADKNTVASSASCNTDNDCSEEQWCLAGQCTALGCPAGTKAQNHDCVAEAKSGSMPVVEKTVTGVNEQKNNPSEPPAAQPEKVPDANAPKQGFFAKIAAFLKSIFF